MTARATPSILSKGFILVFVLLPATHRTLIRPIRPIRGKKKKKARGTGASGDGRNEKIVFEN